MAHLLEKKIENRLHDIYKYIIESEQNTEINLMGGLSGEILFLAYYSRHFKNVEALESISPRLEFIFDKINSGENYPTFASGLCGVNWTVEHLSKNNFIQFDTNDLYETSDEFLYEWMINFMLNHNYDFLHGALGIANYFANRNTFKTNSFVNKFISMLEDNSDKDDNTDMIGFKSTIYSTGEPFSAYNFGLSHGMASIVYFLNKCNKLDLNDNDKSNQMLKRVLSFFNHHKNDITQYNSFYPTWIGESNKVYNARIAWCYGDIGISSVFSNLAVADSSVDYAALSNALLNNSLSKTDPEKETIIDAAICHGSSGLALLYKDAYDRTSNNSYLKSSEYWLNHCLNENKYSDGACGYKSYMGLKKGWSVESGLLEGISGIGLVLLSILDKENDNWKECLMLK